MSNKPKNYFIPVFWVSIGAILSLVIVCPLVIALVKYDWLNHSKPLLEVIFSSYKYFLLQIHFENLIMVMVFLAGGGLIGYLLYRFKISIAERKMRLSLEEMLQGGESEFLEFKSSLRWDYKLNKISKEIELAGLKTIAAFMNAMGGTLLIGIADNAAIVGLEKDYQSLKKKNRDSFEQHIMELVALYIGTECCKNIRVTFYERNGFDVCAVKVNHSRSPVFLKYLQTVSFYVRTGNHTRELNIQEALKYTKTHKI